MKILFVSESIWMAGVVFDLHMMAEGLALLGHTVHAMDPGEQSGIGPIGQLQGEDHAVSRVFPGGTVHLRSPRFPSLHIGKRRVDTMMGVRFLHKGYGRYRELDRLLRNEQYDVVVLYSAIRSGAQTVRVARKYGVPVVFRNVDMLHKLWPTPFERRMGRQLERHVYRRVAMSLALTPKYAEYLIALGADPKKVELLLFPIDREQFRPEPPDPALQAQWGIAPTDAVIAFIGTIYEFSGLAHFIRQFPSILAQVPEAKLLLVGDGPLRPELERTIAELNLQDRVVITGYQPFADMPRYVNAATICLNVFPITDTTRNLFSAKIVQYLSCGKATVSTALPGITTLIPEERAGVLYADTFEGLASAAVGLLQSPDHRRRLEEAGVNYVAEHHGHMRVIARLEELLKQLVRKPQAVTVAATRVSLN
jgi:glycosyltransferase involved in cell wall biosynthesis